MPTTIDYFEISKYLTPAEFVQVLLDSPLPRVLSPFAVHSGDRVDMHDLTYFAAVKEDKLYYINSHLNGWDSIPILWSRLDEPAYYRDNVHMVSSQRAYAIKSLYAMPDVQEEIACLSNPT